MFISYYMIPVQWKWVPLNTLISIHESLDLAICNVDSEGRSGRWVSVGTERGVSVGSKGDLDAEIKSINQSNYSRMQA